MPPCLSSRSRARFIHDTRSSSIAIGITVVLLVVFGGVFMPWFARSRVKKLESNLARWSEPVERHRVEARLREARARAAQSPSLYYQRCRSARRRVRRDKYLSG